MEGLLSTGHTPSNFLFECPNRGTMYSNFIFSAVHMGWVQALDGRADIWAEGIFFIKKVLPINIVQSQRQSHVPVMTYQC